MAPSESEAQLILDITADDNRPTFIVEPSRKTSQRSCETVARVVSRNAAFERLLGELGDTVPTFEAWITSTFAAGPPLSPVGTPGYMGVFGDREWACKSLRCGWCIVYCRTPYLAPKSAVTKVVLSNGDNHTTDKAVSSLTEVLLDWTRFSHVAASPWNRYLRNLDWKHRAVGAIDTWDPVLRSRVVAMMASPEPRCLFWGDDLIWFYNEVTVPIVSHFHPAALGQPLVFSYGPSINDFHYQNIRKSIFEERVITLNAVELLTDVAGLLSETYWNIHYTPLISDDGRWCGCMFDYTEVTPAVFQADRERTTAALTKCAQSTSSISDLWLASLAALDRESGDISYAVLYTTDKNGSPHTMNLDPHETASPYHFVAAFGLDAETFRHGPPPGLVKALLGVRDSITLLESRFGTLPEELAITGPRGIVCSAFIAPITTNIGAPLAYIVLGMNPRRPLAESGHFVASLRDLLARSAALIKLPEERARVEKANIELLDQLRLTKVMREKNEETLQRLYRAAPFGMFIFDTQCNPKFVNDAYLGMLGVTKEEFTRGILQQGYAWFATIYHEMSMADVDAMFREVAELRKPITFELRLKDRPGEEPRWLQGSAFAELDEAGGITTIQGFCMDASVRKTEEFLKDERLNEALDNKRAAERFLDMISHEIRNPLASILLLADEILATASSSDEKALTLSADKKHGIVQAAKTLSMCAMHQKNIVDDVLTLSKLDSNLLVLSLDKTNPSQVAKTGLQMLAAELDAAKITSSVDILPSFWALKSDELLMDSSRVLQVMINLLTNAIKFTRDSDYRNITIEIGASSLRPENGALPVALIPLRPKNDAGPNHAMLPTPSVSRENSINEDEVYLHFSVKDTGKGLTQDEISHLFHRFGQASPKTYKQYGGSGLGLFICRELVELHGGQIGVASEYNRGSTFMFYVKAARAQADMTVVNPRVPSLDSPPQHKRPQLALRANSEVQSKRPTRDLHVLVVDDNLVNLKVIVRQLRRVGCKTVNQREDGQEALDYLLKTNFHKSAGQDCQPLSVMLLDIEMPVLDGLSCIRRIREMEKTGELVRHVPVIAITANARPQQISEALEAGMDKVASKPFQMDDLLTTMENLVVQHEVMVETTG